MSILTKKAQVISYLLESYYSDHDKHNMSFYSNLFHTNNYNILQLHIAYSNIIEVK